MKFTQWDGSVTETSSKDACEHRRVTRAEIKDEIKRARSALEAMTEEIFDSDPSLRIKTAMANNDWLNAILNSHNFIEELCCFEIWDHLESIGAEYDKNEVFALDLTDMAMVLLAIGKIDSEEYNKILHIWSTRFKYLDPLTEQGLREIVKLERIKTLSSCDKLLVAKRYGPMVEEALWVLKKRFQQYNSRKASTSRDERAKRENSKRV